MPLEENRYGMRDIQRMLLDMMVEIDRVCRENGIEYSLLGGTMLGAVRDGGFIPWDDDLDLAFTKEALARFMDVFPRRSERYTVTDQDTWVCRVVPREPINGQRPFVDLFHFEPVSASPLPRKIKVFLLQLMQGTLKRDADLSRFSTKNRVLLRSTHLLGLPFTRRFKLRVYRWIGSHVACGDGSLLHISDEQFSCLGLTYPASYARSYQDYPFEGHMFRMCTHYHDMLVLHYGDYMTPPPENERVSKHDGQRAAAL